MAAKKYASLLDRIIANTVLSDTCYYKDSWCWLWFGSYRKGRTFSYGVLNVYEKGKTKHLSAHRAAIIASGRRLTSKQVARHKCDNPMCVNPDHLVSGTQKQNMQDAPKRGRL